MRPAAPAANNQNTDAALRWLLLIFMVGLLLVIGLRVFFADLQEELNQRSANERARLFVGEELVRSIHDIEKDIYQMAVTANPAGMRLIRRNIESRLKKLTHDLGVLKTGGSVRREILLNLEGRDEMAREMHYTPPPGDQGYVMELIEIAPLLEQIRSKSDELETLLQARWEAQEKEDKQAFFVGEEKIHVHLKRIPPFFLRLDENANRLFFDASEQLRTLEEALALQRTHLGRIEASLVGLVVILAVLAAALVINRIRRANQARESALAAARESRDQAERASRAKTEFVSRMSHELRTPLNAIIGFAQLLEAENMPPTQKNYVTLINSSGAHLMELINAVLDHAKIEAGSMMLEEIPFNLHTLIDSVRSIVLERATQKGLNFITAIDPNLPIKVIGDPTRLRQILINLLTNAVKFTEQGSVELRIAADAGQLIASIRDSGIGMDADTLQRLFQPFAQADASTTRKFGGTGLGLLISKELSEAMGGHIEVDSAIDVGTCFWLHLPLKLADAAPLPAPGSEPAAPTESASIDTLLGGRVLLVDDNRINQQLASAMLKRLKIEHDIASSGREALQRSGESAYALVLMDMEMPEMDGVTATREIRAREAASGAPHLPIVAMTANALAEDRQRCFDAGMDGFIAKPVSMAALESEIRRLFSA